MLTKFTVEKLAEKMTGNLSAQPGNIMRSIVIIIEN
jgi:hypothetical protein